MDITVVGGVGKKWERVHGEGEKDEVKDFFHSPPQPLIMK